ncbi:EF-Tu/IF-2/RF-3 family GTPase [Halomonas sp. JS92-SW72]|uniref:EF-Tu/IF-2/RF-3 family GTPase n=1 Tax=Halomonas sp. JS92-SW72 TaxID=2306583 RepID=UPI0013C32628|nr:EF-Tu/IF-2/RF-3 family GTPase [Halomonas sp. JS92-SW72]
MGDVLAGRVEQGIVKPGDEVIFMPTHTAANKCEGKVFTVEMHHKRVDKAGPGDNVGMTSRAWTRATCPALAMS